MAWIRRPRAGPVTPGSTGSSRPGSRAAGSLGRGLALIGGFVLRICEVAGTVKVGLMRVAEWVPAPYLADGSQVDGRTGPRAGSGTP
ncbi:hypothetical protein OG788_05555 [Streptomyces sp. NBC_00647]|uniref:hypothetical protein n=1 Tax=Streptomyces sp. NBC_00647 TaxID=2975796 RepID=UPI00324DC75E